MIMILGIIENIINPPEKIVIIIYDSPYIRFLKQPFPEILRTIRLILN